MSAHTPVPPHTPWTMHDDNIPYIICGERGPSFGPVTMAGTTAEMMTIATVMYAAPDLLAALQSVRQFMENGLVRRGGLAESEALLATIDAAIAKATP